MRSATIRTLDEAVAFVDAIARDQSRAYASAILADDLLDLDELAEVERYNEAIVARATVELVARLLGLTPPAAEPLPWPLPLDGSESEPANRGHDEH